MKDSTDQIADVLDPEVLAGLRELGGDEFLADLVAIILEDLPQHLNDLRAAVAGHDHDAIVAIAHSQKSSCAQLGALAMSALFRKIEDAGRAEAEAGIGAVLAGIETEWQRVREALEGLAV